ncbi:hypothetical protein CLOM_g22798 [Closterium sp. NIES-68]|nr:hypothetical protein CLOM_g22798 [Closterium sp. NIES-68]
MPPSFCPNLQHTAAAAAAAAAADRGAGSADRPVNECMPRGASSQADWLALGRQGGGKSQERGEGGAEMGEGGEERQVEGRREKRALNAVYGAGELEREEERDGGEHARGERKQARQEGGREVGGGREDRRARDDAPSSNQRDLSLFLSLGVGLGDVLTDDALKRAAFAAAAPLPAAAAAAAAAAGPPTPLFSPAVDAAGRAGRDCKGTSAGHGEAPGGGEGRQGTDSPARKPSNEGSPYCRELSCKGSPDGRKPSNESSPAVRTPCKESSPGGSQRSRSSSQREHQHQHNHPQQRQLEQGEERHGNSKKMRVKVFKEGTLIARTVYLSLFSDFPSLSAHIAAMFGPALKAGRGGAGQGHDMVADGSPGKAGTAGAVAAGAAATGAGQREGADASAAAGAASGDAAGGAAASDAAGAGSAAGAAAGAGSAAGAGAAAGGGSAGGSAGGSDAGASDAGDATDLLAGWHFVYEDSDGDTLLVGDGTWSDFCKHARVLRLVRDE